MLNEKNITIYYIIDKCMQHKPLKNKIYAVNEAGNVLNHVIKTHNLHLTQQT